MFLTAFALLSSGYGPFEGWSLPQPLTKRVIGVVRSIDPQTRKIQLDVELEIETSGKELFYGTPKTLDQAIPTSIPVIAAENPSQWLGLGQVKAGDLVALTMGTELNDLRRVFVVHPRLRAIPPTLVSRSTNPTVAPDKVSDEKVTVPMTFPVLSKVTWSDTFLASRSGGSRRHLGQDLSGPKLTPLVACFDGKIWLKDGGPGGHHYLSLTAKTGWKGVYMHVNNDLPGTDDGNGGLKWAFAPGITTGSEVSEGQIIAFMGDSGNAEDTGSHLHFELWTPEGVVVNATPSLTAAKYVTVQSIKLPYPDWNPQAGYTRRDGTFTSVDAATRRVTMMYWHSASPTARSYWPNEATYVWPENLVLPNPNMKAVVFLKGENIYTWRSSELPPELSTAN